MAGISRGVLIENWTTNIALLQSLLAHNYERNPYAKGATTTYTANNVFYDGGSTFYMDPDGQGHCRRVLSECLSRRSKFAYQSGDDFRSFPAVRVSGVLANNLLDGGTKTISPVMHAQDGVDPTVGLAPVKLSGYTPMDASTVQGVSSWPTLEHAQRTEMLSIHG